MVYFATILHAQNLKVEHCWILTLRGEQAAKQDTLVNALGTKRILRTKDAYTGNVANAEIEDMLRETLLAIAKEQLNWDATTLAEAQLSRSIVDIIASVAKKDFSKYKLAKAFIRWSRDHDLSDLKPHEIEQTENLVAKINKALS